MLSHFLSDFQKRGGGGLEGITFQFPDPAVPNPIFFFLHFLSYHGTNVPGFTFTDSNLLSSFPVV